jgi:hypothetical protein
VIHIARNELVRALDDRTSATRSPANFPREIRAHFR